MMRQGILPAAAGMVIGMALSTALGRLIESYLFGIEPTEPSAYAAVLAVGLGLLGAASWLPARRAARVDPLVALREE